MLGLSLCVKELVKHLGREILNVYDYFRNRELLTFLAVSVPAGQYFSILSLSAHSNPFTESGTSESKSDENLSEDRIDLSFAFGMGASSIQSRFSLSFSSHCLCQGEYTYEESLEWDSLLPLEVTHCITVAILCLQSIRIDD